MLAKYECQRDEFSTDNNRMLISHYHQRACRFHKQANIDLKTLEEGEFDAPLGESTGAGVIFGATGGVIEAAVRTAYELQTGKS